MKELLLWLLRKEQVFTLITVVLSGLISWLVSAIYFKKSNRDALRSNVLYPMKRILEEENSWKNYKLLLEMAKEYSSKYLSKNERIIVDTLLSNYREVCNYNYESVCAQSLFSYFCYKLEQNGIDPKPVPVYIEDEFVDVDFPPDLLYMKYDLANVIKYNPPEFDEDFCLEKIEALFKSYCKKCFTDDDILFFDDFNLTEVLKNAKNRIEWDNKFSKYKNAENSFLSLKSFSK